MIRVIERFVVACFAGAWVALTCFGLAELSLLMALGTGPSLHEPPLLVQAAIIAASVAFGIAVAFAMDRWLNSADAMHRRATFCPKSADGWLVVLLLLGLLIGPVLKLAWIFLEMGA